MNSRRALLSLAFLLALAQSSLFFAQTPPAKPESSDIPTFQSTTSLVFLDVTVLDKKGHPVTTGLTKDDFTITEDKKPQRIFSFEAPESHIMAKGAKDDAPDGKAAITIFVLDQLNSSLDDFAFIRDSMQKYLDRDRSQLSAPAELMVLGNRSLELVQGYTRNRDDLLFALRHIPNALPYKLNAAFKDDRFFQSIQALQQIALQNKGISGRKNIVWLGHGGPGLTTDYINSNSVDKVNQFVHSTTNMLVDARISLFVIYPGLKVREISVGVSAQAANANVGVDPFAGDINFGELVNESGGKLFYNRNDVDFLIKQAQLQGAEYYTLTYQPHDGYDDGKFRKIIVSLRDPNLQVVTKGGYYAPDAKKPVDPEQQTIINVSQAVQSAIPYTGLSLKIDNIVRHPDSRTMNFTVLVQSKNIRWQSAEDGTSKANLILAALCLSSSRQILSSKLQGVAFSVTTQDPTALEHQTLRVPMTLRLPKQAHNIRVAVETEDGGRIGAADIDRKTIDTTPAVATPEPQTLPRPGSPAR